MCGFLQVFLIRHIVQIPARWWGWEPVLILRSNSIYMEAHSAQKSEKSGILLQMFRKKFKLTGNSKGPEERRKIFLNVDFRLLGNHATTFTLVYIHIYSLHYFFSIFRALCQYTKRNFTPVFITLHSAMLGLFWFPKVQYLFKKILADIFVNSVIYLDGKSHRKFSI